MDDNARLKLQQMIKANNVSDQTDIIRNLKHSSQLRESVSTMLKLKKQCGDPQEFAESAIRDCYFLYLNYTDIFNKIRKDEININILNKFIEILKRIEDGELDQHEGSFAVGTLLKELYIDSALKKSEKLDELNEKERSEPKKAEVNVSWKQFKKMGK